MRTAMSDRALAIYLNLSRPEFEALMAGTPGIVLEVYRDLDLISKSLDMLATRYNRPPPASEESDAALEAASARAFARLDQTAADNEAHRRVRSEGSQRARQPILRGQRDPLCWLPPREK